MLRLVHPFPSVLVTAVTLAFVPFADPHARLSLYLELGFGMACFQFAIGTANDLADAALDREAKPWKPIAAGLVTPRTAGIVAVALAGAGAGVTSTLPWAAWYAGLAGLGCGLAYDVSLKRTPLSWLPLSVALPLVPLWVFLAAEAWDHLLWWALPIGVLFGLSLHLANQLADLQSDRASGVRGAAHMLGARRAFAGALGAFGAGASVAVVALLPREPSRAGLVAAVALVLLVTGPRATRLFGRDGLFGVLAVGAAAAAVVFVSAV